MCYASASNQGDILPNSKDSLNFSPQHCGPVKQNKFLPHLSVSKAYGCVKSYVSCHRGQSSNHSHPPGLQYSGSTRLCPRFDEFLQNSHTTCSCTISRPSSSNFNFRRGRGCHAPDTCESIKRQTESREADTLQIMKLLPYQTTLGDFNHHHEWASLTHKSDFDNTSFALPNNTWWF